MADDKGAMIERLSPGDPSSYSRPEECIVTDLSLDIHVDFTRKVIYGTGVYSCRRMEVGVDALVSTLCFTALLGWWTVGEYALE